jgi:hypothetical protein
MGVQVFGKVQKGGNAAVNSWEFHHMDVNDVYVNTKNGGTATITGITLSVTGSPTSIAYNATGSFAASPQTYSAWLTMLASGSVTRTSYRGGKDGGAQWPVNEFDKAGLTSGETVTNV